MIPRASIIAIQQSYSFEEITNIIDKDHILECRLS